MIDGFFFVHLMPLTFGGKLFIGRGFPIESFIFFKSLFLCGIVLRVNPLGRVRQPRD
jgi:hypothetical protein